MQSGSVQEQRRLGLHSSQRRAGSQGGFNTSIAFEETPVLEGIAALIGSVGDAYGNALAKSTIGLFETEAVSKSSPFLNGPMKNHRRCRVRHYGGRLVQPTPTPQHPRLPHTRRIQDGLRSRIGSPPGDVASVGAARNPGQFMVTTAVPLPTVEACQPTMTREKLTNL